VPVDCRRFPLRVRFEPGMSSEALYERYTLFGHDPFMVPIYPNGPSVSFPRGIMPVADVWTLPDRWAARKPPL
jgi:hypothetical protein